LVTPNEAVMAPRDPDDDRLIEAAKRTRPMSS
jgi:hypothetical protein